MTTTCINWLWSSIIYHLKLVCMKHSTRGCLVVNAALSFASCCINHSTLPSCCIFHTHSQQCFNYNMYICLSFHTHVSKSFTWSLKAACIQIIKAKQSLYYTHAQASSASKVCFFPYGKQGMRISSFVKWAWPVLTRAKMKSSPEALLEEF